MTRVARCKKTIAHWKRMIAWVKSVVADYSVVDVDIMADCIGEDWYSNACSFCSAYSIYGDTWQPTCHPTCPIIAAHYPGCMSRASHWSAVDRTKTWRKWLSAAEKMLAMLEDVLKQEQRRAAKH